MAPVESQTLYMCILAALRGLKGSKKESVNVEGKVVEVVRGRIGGKETGVELIKTHCMYETLKQ